MADHMRFIISAQTSNSTVFPNFHGNRGIPTFVRSLNTLHTCFVCPYLSLTPTTDLLQMHRTRVSTLVLARVLISLFLTPRGRTGHERAHRAHLCPVSPYLGFFGHPEHRRAHLCSPVSLFLSF